MLFGAEGGVSACLVSSTNAGASSSLKLTTEKDLSFRHVLTMLKDKSGNLWIGSQAGLCQYDHKSVKFFGEKDGIQKNVGCILEDKQGNLWFGNDNGKMLRYDGKNFSKFTLKETSDYYGIFCGAEDRNGHIWVGTITGVHCYDGKTFRYLPDSE